MKTKSILAIILVFVTLFTSCKKCYTCSGDIPVLLPDGTPSSVTFYNEYSFCERKWAADLIIEEYEDDGYTCLEND